MDDQLGDHRVVVRRDRIAFLDARIDAHGQRLYGRHQMHQPAGRGQEALVGILGVEARLDGVTADRELLLRQRQRLAGRDAQLPLDEVEAGDHLGDRMLDLQARVHFHEVEGTAHFAHCVGDELDRAGADVTDCLRRLDRRPAHGRAALGAHARRRRFFQHLLVATLHRAVALEKMHHVALGIAEYLHLDVARPLQVFLDQHAIVAEAARRLALARSQGVREFGCAAYDAHALAAAARAGLDQHRPADALRLAGKKRRFLVVAVVAGDERHAGPFHQRLGRRLGTHGADGSHGRADEDESRCGAGLREVLVLRQEAVARMDGLRACLLRGSNDALDVQVGLARGRRADADRRVGHAHVASRRVGFRVHRHRPHAQAACRADDPAGDFTAIGDQ